MERGLRGGCEGTRNATATATEPIIRTWGDLGAGGGGDGDEKRSRHLPPFIVTKSVPGGLISGRNGESGTSLAAALADLSGAYKFGPTPIASYIFEPLTIYHYSGTKRQESEPITQPRGAACEKRAGAKRCSGDSGGVRLLNRTRAHARKENKQTKRP